MFTWHGWWIALSNLCQIFPVPIQIDRRLMQFLKIEQPKKKLCSESRGCRKIVNAVNFTDDLGGQNREALKTKLNSGCPVNSINLPWTATGTSLATFDPFPPPPFLLHSINLFTTKHNHHVPFRPSLSCRACFVKSNIFTSFSGRRRPAASHWAWSSSVKSSIAGTELYPIHLQRYQTTSFLYPRLVEMHTNNPHTRHLLADQPRQFHCIRGVWASRIWQHQIYNLGGFSQLQWNSCVFDSNY